MLWISVLAVESRERSESLEDGSAGMRVFVAGKLVQRGWQDNDGNKRQSVEIQATHVGPDLQFTTAEVGARIAVTPSRRAFSS